MTCTWWLIGLALKEPWSDRVATPCPDCMDRLRKHYPHSVEGWFLARKAAWAVSECGHGQSHESAYYPACECAKGLSIGFARLSVSL